MPDSTALSLLAHITYHDSNVTQATAGASLGLKASSGWRSFAFNCLVKLLEEMEGLRSRDIEVGDNLRVSCRAHVVMPYHQSMDGALEECSEVTRPSANSTRK